MIGESLEHDLLDLLVDGASSFGVLYGALVEHCGYTKSLELSEVMNALGRMEQQGWVDSQQMSESGDWHKPTAGDLTRDLLEYQSWIPRAEFEELSVDEIGLWYEITGPGRTEWRRWFPQQDEEVQARWMIDDLRESKTLIVHASTSELAEEKLHWWLSRKPQIDLVPASRRMEPVSVFTLRDGTTISDGLKLVYKYTLRAGDPSKHSD